MNKYKHVKEKLNDLGIQVGDLLITDQDLVKDYEESLKQGKDLPNGVIHKQYRRILDNGEVRIDHSFYQERSITDDSIKALIEVEQTKALQSISRSMKFFVVLAVISVLFVLIGGLFAG